MNIKEVLTELDGLFEKHRMEEIEPFLQDKLLEAKQQQDTASMITIVNELIGFYRDRAEYQKALGYCDQVVTLMEKCGFAGTVPFATTLLNVANAFRAAGKWEESEQAYVKVEEIYAGNVSPNDYRYASLYNNWSLLYQEKGEFEKARKSLEQALSIISKFNNTQIEIASTHTNLATTLLRLGETKEAMDHLIMALSIFEEDGGKDFHYSAALSAMGDAKYLCGDLEAASDYYQKALVELERNVGKSEAYERIAENLRLVKEKMGGSQEEKNMGQEKSFEKVGEKNTEFMEEAENQNKDLDQMEFTISQPSEDDFDDDYDIDNEEDFERNDFDIEDDHVLTTMEKPSEEDFEETIDEDDFEESVDEEDYEEDGDKMEETMNLERDPEKEAVLAKAAEELDVKPYPVVEGPSGLEICEEFYQEVGAKMIHEKFPAYEGKIAVGLVGEGSDCFGYDDFLSRDHDFGPGFAMWVTDETYQAIGEELKKAYEELPREYKGYQRLTTEEGKDRIGVCKISEFYSRVIGYPREPETEYEWYNTKIGSLRAATNGKVFRDDEGIFTGIRTKLLELYPEKVRIFKIAEECAYLSQYGQYNYPRMMIRRDYVTAKILIAQFMQHSMQIIYLLNRMYEPYYKWQRTGMDELAILPEVGCILDALADMPDQRAAWAGDPTQYDYHAMNQDDSVQMTMEIICQMILDELKQQELVTGEDTYLDHHRAEMLAVADDPLQLARARKISRERVQDKFDEKNGIEKDYVRQVMEENEVQEFIPVTPSISKDFFASFSDEDFCFSAVTDADNIATVQIPEAMGGKPANNKKTFFYQDNEEEAVGQKKEATIPEPNLEEAEELFQKLQEQEQETPYTENSPSAQEMLQEEEVKEEAKEETEEIPEDNEEARLEEAKRIAESIEQNKAQEEKDWVEEAKEKRKAFCRPEENQDLVDKVVDLEWKQFDQVQNEGGRANCQDDWATFSIMRKSQYITWNRELLESFLRDLTEAQESGWNLITEKYARMMESTVPLRYEALKDDLPHVTEDKKNLCEEIIKIQIGWMEEFAEKYPNMAYNARCIHTSEDTPYETSYETYLRGELLTYSDETLTLYGKMIVNLAKEGENLAEMIMNNTALLYGYESLDAANDKLNQQK